MLAHEICVKTEHGNDALANIKSEYHFPAREACSQKKTKKNGTVKLVFVNVEVLHLCKHIEAPQLPAHCKISQA